MFLEISLSRNNKQKHINWNYFNYTPIPRTEENVSYPGLGS